MGKKILDNKILYMLLSIFLSVVLWFYVSAIQGDTRPKTITNIPVTFTGTDVLRENGLMLMGPPPTATLEVQANITTLAKLDAQSLTLVVDVSRITEPTQYTMSYDVVPPAGVSESSFTVSNRTPANVSFTVARYDTKEVPVQGALATGESSIAEGFVGHGFQFSPETITVSGRADLVAQVHHALVTISGENLSETVQAAKTYQLIGADDEPLEDLDVTCSPETVDTTYEILKEIEVPLRVVLEKGGGATDANVSFLDISPSTVSVLGRPEDLESLKELTVASINLGDIDGTEILTYDIPLDDSLEISGGASTVTITITVDGLSKDTVTVGQENITLTNVPAGFRAQVSTRSLVVAVRGTESALEQVSADNIRVTVDLSEVNPVSGQYMVPAKVQFDSVDGAGVLGSNYQVTVRLSQK